jgi:hypothetical protein
MIKALHNALDKTPYSERQADKEHNLLTGLTELTQHHYSACPNYARILDGAWTKHHTFETIADLPYLPVSIFKTQKMQSVPDEEIRVTLTSSGTSGQAVSRIRLDKDASSLQQRALANSLKHILGDQRLPMLVIDSEAVFADPRLMSARGAGVLGIMRYGRNHAFALDKALKPNFELVQRFLEEVDGKPFFIFGFTFMVWTVLFEQFKSKKLDLSNGTLIHSGGWKTMADRAIDNASFRTALTDTFGLRNIHNFYGMVELIGTLYLEGPDQLLYPPNFADVIIRDPITWKVAEVGQPGVVQVTSLLPHSYPGHSLLTEDLGVIEAVDPGTEGWHGKGFRILGRVPKAELRGCSDVIAATV